MRGCLLIAFWWAATAATAETVDWNRATEAAAASSVGVDVLHDKPRWPGNRGGPAIDERGHVVGVAAGEQP